MSRLGLRPRGVRALHERVFARIHDTNAWGDDESVSGRGSTKERGAAFTPELIATLRALGVRSLLDAPCGDFNWIEPVADAVDEYIGMDVVPQLIERNRAQSANARRRFLTGDLTRDALPRVDAILSRDCLVHFSFADVHAALRNFRRSGATYLFATTFLGVANEDIRTGGWRVIDLEAKPFALGAPVALIDEHCTHSGGIYRNKRIGVWKL